MLDNMTPARSITDEIERKPRRFVFDCYAWSAGKMVARRPRVIAPTHAAAVDVASKAGRKVAA